MKTDRRAFYLVDPTTGDVVWLFSDGTYALGPGPSAEYGWLSSSSETTNADR
ncbi:MAG TPA: hypothetical protein H9978_01630 [Candidatus Corynebacterium faecipullorum]|nr:hypothetical protein [Candidatus Corynebacterium faecipullorum]